MSNNAPGSWGPQQQGPGQWGPQPGPPGPFGSGPYGGPPPQPQPPRTGNVGLAVPAGVGAMLVGAGVYGVIVKSMEIQSTWFGVGIAALIALAMGKIGGANPALPVIAVPLALLGVLLGQLTAVALFNAEAYDVPVVEFVSDHASDMWDAWKENVGFGELVVFVIAGVAAFGITKSVGGK
ncbi:hypothetical protein [Embleya sp. NPDC059237]|uniref:hypothetical protein n=1 Tax=Embleya sp. NPDC059237 TaxID=3346784 RepID=UPI0036AA2F8F